MNDFKIIEEQTLDYKRKDQLWLMLIRTGEKFGIEVNSRSSLVGRMFANSRKEAQAMFDDIGKKLGTIYDIDTAWDLLRTGFQQTTVKECMFCINLQFQEFDFNALCKLKRKYGYKTLPRIEDLIWESKDWERTIQVFFPGRSVPIAKFVPVSDEEDANFKLELNPVYFPQ